MKIQNLHTEETFEFVRTETVPDYPSPIKVWILKDSKGSESEWNQESMYLGFCRLVWIVTEKQT